MITTLMAHACHLAIVPDGHTMNGWPLDSIPTYAIRVHRGGFISVVVQSEMCRAPRWDVAMLTSGSTGTPKWVFIRRDQLDLTAEWYRQCYTTSADSLIVTCMPLSYNFAFIAGLWQSDLLGCALWITSHEVLLQGLGRMAQLFDRVIVLTTPVAIESLSSQTPQYHANVIFDSGGAPLSTTAIRLFREMIGDLREGYGLTETCSLTHFDREGVGASLGTVGLPMSGVAARISGRDLVGPIVLKSPNACVVGVDASEGDTSRELYTGDIGQIDPQSGRLRLLGRDSDRPIEGSWPRDILDGLGPILRWRCATVRTDGLGVHVGTLRPLDAELVHRLVGELRELLNGARCDVRLECSNGRLLHSGKIGRTQERYMLDRLVAD